MLPGEPDAEKLHVRFCEGAKVQGTPACRTATSGLNPGNDAHRQGKKPRPSSTHHVVIDSSQVGVEKPDPQIFRLALGHLGLPPHEAVYVGDLLDIDVAGARNAGLTPFLYDPWDAYPDVAEGRIRSLAELSDLL